MISNKYEHSWKRIESLDIWSIPFSTPSSNWGEYIKCGEDNEASYQISEDLDLIKELVDKETPMKPLLKKYDMFCPSCNTPVYIDDWNAYLDRCIDCGQKIDWNVD